MGKEAKDAEPVVQRNDDDALSGHARAVVARFGAVAGHEAAAVEVDEHRQRLIRRGRRGPYVEVEAVFARVLAPKDHVVEDALLHALRAEAVGRADVLPTVHGLRRLPPEIADRRGGIRNALEQANAAGLGGPFHGPLGRFYGLGRSRSERKASQHKENKQGFHERLPGWSDKEKQQRGLLGQNRRPKADVRSRSPPARPLAVRSSHPKAARRDDANPVHERRCLGRP